jgi:hypothetical protein
MSDSSEKESRYLDAMGPSLTSTKPSTPVKEIQQMSMTKRIQTMYYQNRGFQPKLKILPHKDYSIGQSPLLVWTAPLLATSHSVEDYISLH